MGAVLPTSSFRPSPRAGIPEDSKVEGPAFTDAIRMYRQSKELYGTWEMLCGNEVQVRPGRLRKSTRGPEGGLSTPAGPGALAAGLDPDDQLRFGRVEAEVGHTGGHFCSVCYPSTDPGLGAGCD